MSQLPGLRRRLKRVCDRNHIWSRRVVKLQSPLCEFGNCPVLSPVTGARTDYNPAKGSAPRWTSDDTGEARRWRGRLRGGGCPVGSPLWRAGQRRASRCGRASGWRGYRPATDSSVRKPLSCGLRWHSRTGWLRRDCWMWHLRDKNIPSRQLTFFVTQGKM
jgi:hypothetical protein